MAKPPPRNRKPLNIFHDDQLGPQGLQSAFAEATRQEHAAEDHRSSSAVSRLPDSGSLHEAFPPVQASATAVQPDPLSPVVYSAPAAIPESRSRAPQKAAQSTPAPALPEKNVGFEIRIPQLTKSEFASFKARLGAALGGVPLTDSHIVRALFECLLVQDAKYVIEVAQEQPRPIKRPANQDLMAQAEFDALLAAVFREGQQRSRRRRPVRSSAEAEA